MIERLPFKLRIGYLFSGYQVNQEAQNEVGKLIQ